MAKTIQARVLFALPELGAKVGDILEADAKLIKALNAQGSVDPDKESVAYAIEQGGAIVKNADPAEALQTEIDALTGQLAAAADVDKPALQAQLDAKTAELDAL